MCLAYPEYDRLMIGTAMEGSSNRVGPFKINPLVDFLSGPKVNWEKLIWHKIPLYSAVKPSVLPRFDEGLTVAVKSNLCTNNVAI